MIEYEFHLNFDQMIADIDGQADKAVLAGMEFMHGQVAPLVPVGETGNLVGEAAVGLGVIDGVQGSNESVAHLYFPGPYALYQHEGVYFRRPAHFGNKLNHTHGESFFLIRPMIQDAETALRVVQESLGL